jgi:hypothetical protein
MDSAPRPWHAHLAGLAFAAVRATAWTVFLFAALGAALAALSWLFLRDLHWAWRLAAGLLALGESVAAGAVVGWQRGLAAAGARALLSWRLGASLIGALFDRLPVSEGAARGLERLPLAEAEARLSEAVVEGTGGAGGWVRGKVQAVLLRAVRRFTLARFREEGARHGGIDLAKVREELARTVDEAVARRLLAAARARAAVGLIALLAVVAAQVALLGYLLSA